MPAHPRSGLTAARALLLLDMVRLVLACCAVVVLVGTAHPISMGTLAFVAANLPLLYATGPYRREALIEMGETLGRVPIAVGVGGLLGWAATASLPVPFGTGASSGC